MSPSPLVVLAAAGLFGALLAGAPFPAALAALSIAALLHGRVSNRVLAAAAVLALVSAARAHVEKRAFERVRAEARDAIGSPLRCAGRGTIETSPTRRGDRMGFIAELGEIDCEGRVLRAGYRVRLYGGHDDVARGDTIDVVAQLAPVRLFRNAELTDPVPFAARQGAVLSGAALSVVRVHRAVGLTAFIDRARAHARARIDATFSPTVAPMARALVLGENDLDPEDDAAFRLSGLSHLLAVSGTHLVFAVVALVTALSFVLVRIYRLASRYDVGRFSAAIGAALALLYADFAGGSGSAWRAAWMLCAAFVVRAFGRRPRIAPSFAASLGVGALVDPLAAYDLSFLLSAAATSGLVVLGQPLAKRIAVFESRIVRFVLAAGAATLTSMIPCAPLLASLSSSLTVAGLLANVVAAPFGEVVALPLCLSHPLSTSLPALEKGLALVGSGALSVVRAVARASADATWLQIPVPPPTPWHFAVLAVGGAGAWLAGGERRGRRPWVLATFLSLCLVELATIHIGRPRGVLRVTVLDVGQGDANLVDLPDGSLMLIDAGGFMGSPVDPGRSVVAPVLRMRRRDRVDIVVLSHPHPDHFGGLASALAEVEVGQFWDTGQGRAEGAGPVYAALLESLSARGVPIVGPERLCGRPLRFGAAELRVLAPCPRFVPNINANDNSFVLHVTLGDRAALLTGDAERHEEEALVREHGPHLRADFLKVGHHGSRTSSTPGFIEAVRPTVATISCGVRNRYGHPHAVTLETLAAANVRPLRLDRAGSVEWTTDGRSMRTRVHEAL